MIRPLVLGTLRSPHRRLHGLTGACQRDRHRVNVLTTVSIRTRSLRSTIRSRGVQVPVAVAANVCGTTVAVLSAAGSGGACTATSGNNTLGQAIVRQVLKQKSVKN